MVSLGYAEINGFCAVLLCLVLKKTLEDIDHRRRRMMFAAVLINCIILFTLDFLWYFMEGNSFMTFLVNGLYFIWSGFVGYYWLLYSEEMLGSQVFHTRKQRVIWFIPALILVVLVATSYWTGWILYVDYLGVYHRGPYHVLQILLGLGYIVAAGGHALWEALKKEHYVRRNDYLALAACSLYPLLGGILQKLFFGLPFLCMGVTVGILNLNFESLRRQIQVDALTGINNRSRMLQHLKDRMMAVGTNHELCLVYLDIRNFRRVNDIFGYEEGEQALITVAEVLKRICRNRSYFLSRYGGDEFMLVCEGDEVDTGLLCRSIQEEIDRAMAKKPYQIVMDVGCARYQPGTASVQKLIQEARGNCHSPLKSGIRIQL